MLALAAGCATVPTEYREPAPLAAEERAALNGKVFDRVWELVNEKYFDASFRGVDWAAMPERYRDEAVAATDDEGLYRVLNRMCAELKESHLVALTPRRVHENRVDHRAAIGVRWEMLEGKRVVVDVVPGGPAEEAGVQRGWLVVSRNGAPLVDGEVFITRIGEPVTYGFLDEHETLRTFTFEPRLLNFERFEERVIAGGYVCLRFDEFGGASMTWLRRMLREHRDAPGVILDLRNNHGGNTFALSAAVGNFFPHKVAEGRIVKRDGDTRESHSFGWGSARYGGRVVVLVGPATGSAAEILTHVLQHHRRATAIGRRTAGAVIYSRLYRLPGGGRLQV
ncbi:MAG TPA: S41 family peptidase, partial [Opitutus sp.]|nr:S41 family peptidase [Opitutus sp.]